MRFVVVYTLSAAALILVATYYLLASIPFSYYHFLQVPQVPGLPLFMNLHPLVLAAALGALLPRARTAPEAVRPWIRYVAIFGVSIAMCMAATVVLPVLLSYELAAALSFLPLILLTAISILRIAAAPPHRPNAERLRGAAALGGTGALAGLLIGAAYATAGGVRGAVAAFGRRDFLIDAGIAIGAHVGCFTLAALAVALTGAWARRSRASVRAERLVLSTVSVVAGAVLIRRSLLTALLLADLRAAFVAAALATAIVAAVWALRATVGVRGQEQARAAAPAWAALVAVLVVLVGIVPPMLRLIDWGGSLQKTLVLVTWAAGVALAGRAPRSIRNATVAAVVGAFVLVATTASVLAGRTSAPASVGAGQPTDLDVAIERYGTFDASMTVLLDVFRPVLSDDRFFSSVRAAGDVTDDRSLPAVPVSLADVAQRPAGRPPHIFIVVVDSLRPDYLLPYNAAASFTPAIGAFARDSIVMRRAFTQYAGTALSQPAIWAGALIQRAMYIKPFAAVNNLERLTVAAGYRRYVSVDPPLSAILEDWTGLVRLDAHLTHPENRDQMFKFDICSTVPELLDRLAHDGARDPVFFYSQPQNVHIRTLEGDAYPRDDRVSIGGASFFKPAVAAIARVDGCFGRLVDGLKAQHLYDDSIVVLTSDHGDSYGEAGRWAHAFYMAPETLRIPLIVHVPARYLAGRTWDPDDVAALTDLTPTLYDLLGYTPTATGELVGRSLVRRPGEPRPERSQLLVQSSYSRVYGLLGGDGSWIYVADANHNREELFDVTGGSPFGRPVAPADRPRFRKWLLDSLERLDRFYGRPTSR